MRKSVSLLLFMLSIAPTVLAQTVVGGSWVCADDAGNGVIQSLPPKASQIDQVTRHFAPRGSLFEVALAKGGPTGMFITGHLHAIHNDRSGHTDYAGIVLIRDESGYYYAALPRLATTVRGKASRPDRHRHCGQQFTLPESLVKELTSALEKGARIHLEVAASRDRNNAFDELSDSVKDKLSAYLAGQLSAGEVLSALNLK